MRLTERGFIIFGEVTDTHRAVARVQESSAIGEEAACWVFTHDREGNDVVTARPGGPMSISPHLTRGQARELALLLLKFADSTDEQIEQDRELLRSAL